MEEFVTLVVVQDGAARKVVSLEAPEVNVGDLVEYVVQEQEQTEDPVVGIRYEAPPEKTALGLVLKKLPCDRFENEWSFVAEISTIHRGKAVYRCVWNRPAEMF